MLCRANPINEAVYHETIGGGPTDGFGVSQSFVDPFFQCRVPAARYLAEFQFTASADACGEFELAWVPSGGVPDGGTAFNVANGVPYILGSSGLQNLTIIVGSDIGDDCAAPKQAADGSNGYGNVCSTEDGNDSCLAGGDTWYTYTATCSGILSVNVSSGNATPAIYDTADACLAGDANSLLCGNGDAPAKVSQGQDYVIQINGDDAGTFDVACMGTCQPCVGTCSVGGNASECADRLDNETLAAGPDGITDDVCTWWQCGLGTCSNDPSRPCDGTSASQDCGDSSAVCVFGDPDACVFAALAHPSDMGGPMFNCEPDGFCNNFDFNMAVLCFTNFAGLDTCPRINIDAGGAFGSCVPDGFCNLFDANQALTCFAEVNPCNCLGGPAPEVTPLVVGGTGLTLESSRRTVRRGATFQVQAYINDPLNALSGYQLHTGVSGGRSGSLELVDVLVADRDDAVFADAGGVFDAFNVQTSQMLSGLHLGSEAVATAGKGYLATFTYRASDDALGTFVIDLVHNNVPADQTFLIGAEDRDVIQITSKTPAVVVVTAGGPEASGRLFFRTFFRGGRCGARLFFARH